MSTVPGWDPATEAELDEAARITPEDIKRCFQKLPPWAEPLRPYLEAEPDSEIAHELRDMAGDDADIIMRKSLSLGADIVLRRDDA